MSEFEINFPSLSERTEDILPLATFFRELFSKELNKVTTGFFKRCKSDLLSYSWSGNIRELHHRIKRAVLLSKNGIISAEDLDLEMDLPSAPRLAKRNEGFVVKAFVMPM